MHHADIVVTCTGNKNVVTRDHMNKYILVTRVTIIVTRVTIIVTKVTIIVTRVTIIVTRVTITSIAA